MKANNAILIWSLLSFPLTFQAASSEFILNPAESAIEVSVKATGDDFVAKLTRFDAKISVSGSNNVPTAAVVSWDFDDLKTGKKGRDKEMLYWLDHERGPQGSFTLLKCEPKSGGLTVTGEIAMHNVKREISFPIVVHRKGEQIAFEGSATLDHRDFGLPRIVKLAVLKVDPALKISFKLNGKLQDQGLVKR